MNTMNKKAQLLAYYSPDRREAGCDEAGRGCLAGPVFAAAVVFPTDLRLPLLNDSKQLSGQQRNELRKAIETNAIDWAVASIDHNTIDKVNILQASFMAMHEAIVGLKNAPELLLIDGNRFRPFPGIPHQCFVKGDARFMAIAAASILAKTHRDEFMQQLHKQFPQYGWDKNKGYPTRHHIEALNEYGPSPFHRMSFKVKTQLRFPFG